MLSACASIIYLALIGSPAIAQTTTRSTPAQNTAAALRYATFAQATAEKISPREYAYMLLQSGAADAGFRVNIAQGRITSPDDARAFLRAIPPVSISFGLQAGVASGSVGIDLRSAAEFAWTLTYAKDAADLDARIQDYRIKHPLADLYMASSITAAFDNASDLDQDKRSIIKDAWQKVAAQNHSLPSPTSSIRDLVSQYGITAVKNFVENYAGRNMSDAELGAYLDAFGGTPATASASQALQSALSTQTAYQRQLAKTQVDILQEIQRQQEQAGQQQIKAAEMRLFENQMRDLKGAVYIGAALFRLSGDAQGAQIVSTAGEGALQIADGVHALLNDPAKLAASANIVGGALLLYSAFGPHQDDPFQSAVLKQQQEILNQLGKVRQQLAEIQFQLGEVQALGNDILVHQTTHFAYIEDEIRALRGNVAKAQDLIDALNLATIMRTYDQDYETAARLLASRQYVSALRRGRSDGQMVTLTGKQLSLATSVSRDLVLVREPAISSETIRTGKMTDPLSKRAAAISRWLDEEGLVDAATNYFVQRDIGAGAAAIPSASEVKRFLAAPTTAALDRAPEPALWFVGTANYLELARAVPPTAINTRSDLDVVCQAGLDFADVTEFLSRVAPVAYASWRHEAAAVEPEMFEFRKISYADALGFTEKNLPLTPPLRNNPFSAAAYLGLTNVPTVPSGWDIGEKAASHGVALPNFQISRLQKVGWMGEECAPYSSCDRVTYSVTGCVYQYFNISVSFGLDLGPFWWFGDAPGEPLPDLSSFASPKRIGRLESGERPLRVNHSKVPASKFRRVHTMGEVLELLFGDLPSGAPPAVSEEDAGTNE